MKHLSYETLRRIMEDRFAQRYHDAAIKTVRKHVANAATCPRPRTIVKFFSAPMLVIDVNSETGLGVSCAVVAGV